MDPILLRFFERMLVVLIGGMAIYLGYRLFLRLPTQRNSEGKIELPGDVSIYLSRVGPGVFFALFGCAVVALSLQNAIEWRTSTAPDPAASAASQSVAAASSEFIGMGSTAAGQEQDRRPERARVSRNIRTLEGAIGGIAEGLDPQARNDLVQAFDDAKRAMILSVWDQDWGDAPAFARWALRGGVGEPPEGAAEPARLYRGGL